MTWISSHEPFTGEKFGVAFDSKILFVKMIREHFLITDLIKKGKKLSNGIEFHETAPK